MKKDATNAKGGASSTPEDATKLDNPENTGDDNDQLNSAHPLQAREDVYARFEENRDEYVDKDEADDEVEVEEDTDEDEPATDTSEDENEDEDDPLAKFVVVKDGKSFFKAIVNGAEQLVPLERAQAQLQKLEAAEQRLQQAAERNRALDAREAQLREREAAAAVTRHSPSPEADDVDDSEELLAESRSLISSLLDDDEDKAAEKLAAALAKARTSGTRVDEAAIAKKVADQFRAEQRQAAEQSDAVKLASAFEAYAAEYSDIEADPRLAAVASVEADKILAENPTWDYAKVFKEAGNRTREFAGIKSTAQDTPTETETTPKPSSRQERKRKLTTLPTPAAARDALPADGKPRQESPKDVINAMRKARGQPAL